MYNKGLRESIESTEGRFSWLVLQRYWLRDSKYNGGTVCFKGKVLLGWLKDHLAVFLKSLADVVEVKEQTSLFKFSSLDLQWIASIVKNISS